MKEVKRRMDILSWSYKELIAAEQKIKVGEE